MRILSGLYVTMRGEKWSVNSCSMAPFSLETFGELGRTAQLETQMGEAMTTQDPSAR